MLIGITSQRPARPRYISRQTTPDVRGVKPQTLYSFVGRRLVRRRIEHGDRSSLYNLQDLQYAGRIRGLSEQGNPALETDRAECRPGL